MITSHTDGREVLPSEVILTAIESRIRNNSETVTGYLFAAHNMFPSAILKGHGCVEQGKAAYLQYSGEEKTSESVNKEF